MASEPQQLATVERRRFLLEMLPSDSVCAEIGVLRGDFSAEILKITRPRTLHLIDPWEHLQGEAYERALYGGMASGQAELDERYAAVVRRFEPEVRAGRVQIHRGYSSDVLEGFPDGYFDWVYIDGNHLYEFVKRDLELSLAKTKAGGYLTGDDYRRHGWWQGGVKRAVDEFARRNALQLVTKRKAQFVLRKPLT